MPKAIDVDWNLARGLAAQGFKPGQIAAKLGCSPGTIRSRAFREKWNELAAKTQEVMQQSPDLAADWSVRAKNWPRRVATLMEKRLEHLESIPVARLSVREIRELAAATAQTDATARTAFGLDGQNTVASVSLNYNIQEITFVTE